MFRECFMLHRTTKTVFAMDSLVEMGEANIPHPVLQAGSKMAGNFGRVSTRLLLPVSLYGCRKYSNGCRSFALLFGPVPLRRTREDHTYPSVLHVAFGAPFW